MAVHIPCFRRSGPGPRVAGFARAFVSLAAAGWLNGLAAAPRQEWLPVSAEELAETKPQLEPDAPAEVLFRKVEVDDRDYPLERVTQEYIRFKIYQPEHIEAITRLALTEYSDNSWFGAERRVKLAGRLTLPNHTEKIFGEEAIHERTVAQSGAEQNLLTRLLGNSSPVIKERFLALSGVEAGAILEYRIEVIDRNSGFNQGFGLQRRELGVREVEYRIRPANAGDWICHYFVLNQSVGHVAVERDRKGNPFTITATNLPALPAEPLVAPAVAYYGLFFLFSYDKVRVQYIGRKPGFGNEGATVDPRKTGPWSPIATRAYVVLDDRVDVTGRVRNLTAQVTAGATGPLDKAQRIHREVARLFARYREESKFNKTRLDLITLSNLTRSIDDLLDYDRSSNVAIPTPRDDFTALAMAMYQAAGLECRAILLPDRARLPYGQNLVAAATLPVLAVGVRIDGEWRFSLPAAWPALAFGALPWFCEGRAGLWLQTGNQQFEPIPPSPPEKSLVGNGGVFTLDANGELTGDGERRYTGHAAETLRQQLFNRDERRRRAILSRQLNAAFRMPGAAAAEAGAAEVSEGAAEEGAEEPPAQAVTVERISGVDDPAAPIEVAYHLRLPGYAVLTADRLVFRSDPFRLNADTPFTASTRKLDVWFPYLWEELDVATIKLPAGYRPSYSGVTGPPEDRTLHYASSLGYDPSKQQLTLRREFACNAVTFPAANYPGLKAWYDEMARGDHQEVVLTKVPAPAAAPAAP
jgi:hypothetical protein